MGLLFDIHLHTSRYSGDSTIDPFRLIPQAVKAGLHGIAITEHHRVWPQEELDELVADANEPGFILLSGFEYTSSHGDALIYGLNPDQADTFIPRQLSPAEAVARAHQWGAACVAAHPTRQGLGFDEQLFDIPLEAIEARSCNLNNNEQRLALTLSTDLNLRSTASSDAHRIQDVGKFATEFTLAIQSINDLVATLQNGDFRLPRSA
ncbi:MAG: PHP-associated domain-containing protein [Candidatus Hydrogenedentota bacterium]